MIYFYKNYDEYSKFATFLSRIGGVFYVFGIFVLFLPLIDESVSQDEPMIGFIMCPILLLIGFGLNTWAKKKALKMQKKNFSNSDMSNVNNNLNRIYEDDKKNKADKVINVSFSSNHLVDDEIDEDSKVNKSDKVINVSFSNKHSIDDEIDEEDDEIDDNDEDREPVKTVIEVSFPSISKSSKKMNKKNSSSKEKVSNKSKNSSDSRNKK